MTAASFALRKSLTRVGVFALVLLCLGAFAAQAEPKFPALTGPVVDNAQLLSQPQNTEISQKIRDFREKTSIQINVVTLPSLQGYEIRDFGNRLFRHWGIGQKDKDNGVLLIVAPIERKVAIEVGYGLEPILTDALSKLIIEHKIIPPFKSGDFAAGIKAGVNDIATLAAQDENAEALKQDYSQDDYVGNEEDISPIAIFILIFVLFIILRNLNGSSSRGHSGGWGGPVGGGWSGGGGGGGWSGGGGSSGGGGASGGW